MARLIRFCPAHHSQHVQQRGHNGQALFLTLQDHAEFLRVLHDCARTLRVDVHAYVLLPNAFRLLLTPQTDDGLPQLMQALGRRYGRYFNQTHQRTGALFDGRYKATLIEAESYLVPTLLHMSLAPLQLGLCASLSDYAWSSHAHFAGQKINPLLSSHSLLWRLGNTPFAREAEYSRLMAEGLQGETNALLNQAFAGNWPLGSATFLAQLQSLTPRRLNKSKAGRPVGSVRRTSSTPKSTRPTSGTP
jgi:putative transposase